MSIDGRGLLIRGASGSGKSALALQLMALGADLVADDQTLLHREGSDVVGRCPEPIADMIEARGMGLFRLRTPAAPQAIIAAVVDMDLTSKERLPPIQERTLLGVTLPCFHGLSAPQFLPTLLLYLRGNIIRAS